MVNLVRDSFSGINARFHLAGAYTVVELLLRITIAALGEDRGSRKVLAQKSYKDTVPDAQSSSLQGCFSEPFPR